MKLPLTLLLSAVVACGGAVDAPSPEAPDSGYCVPSAWRWCTYTNADESASPNCERSDAGHGDWYCCAEVVCEENGI
jgi:hypothetical protein